MLQWFLEQVYTIEQHHFTDNCGKALDTFSQQNAAKIKTQSVNTLRSCNHAKLLTHWLKMQDNRSSQLFDGTLDCQ